MLGHLNIDDLKRKLGLSDFMLEMKTRFVAPPKGVFDHTFRSKSNGLPLQTPPTYIQIRHDFPRGSFRTLVTSSGAPCICASMFHGNK